jgi:hypothetical protein
MKEILEHFTNEYSMDMEKQISSNDEQSRLHYPLVFLFIGDKVAEAAEHILKFNREKWENHVGIAYMHVHTGATIQDDHLSTFMCKSSPDAKMERKSIRDHFYEDKELLFELNRTIRMLGNKLSESGRHFESFERIVISVVTRVDDPLNVLVPEITLLVKTAFASVKTIMMDLYTLMTERDQEDYGRVTAMGIAYLRELQYMQQDTFTYSGLINITDIALTVEHNQSPLFDMVYILSDKNENGIIQPNVMQENYDTICYINLIKNQRTDQSGLNVKPYNNTEFKNNIRTVDNRESYVSAGLAVLRRPSKTIALTALQHLFKVMSSYLNSKPDFSLQRLMQTFQLDGVSIERKIASILPRQDIIDDMQCLLSNDIRIHDTLQLSLRNLEEELFGNSCEIFFHENCDLPTRSNAVKEQWLREWNQAINLNLNDPNFAGLFALYQWTDPRLNESIYSGIQTLRKTATSDLDNMKIALEQIYQERVSDQSFRKFPLFEGVTLKHIKRMLFQRVYSLKLDILRLESKLRYIQFVEGEIERIHENLKLLVNRLDDVEKVLNESLQVNGKESLDYVGQNVPQYYQTVTQSILDEMENKRGTNFYFEDRFIGNIQDILYKGAEELLNRMISVSKQHILNREPFQESFEKELLQRANVKVEYGTSDISSKDDMYKHLVKVVMKQSIVNLQLFNYMQKHRHEESYYFGDTRSEFIKFAMSYEASPFKIGCIHENRRSGISKLKLMGGFHLEDLVYVRTNKQYYDGYLQEGYQLHGFDENQLPPLN